jgi:UTP--glucose-1-phosphate uridylyltransferase
MTESDDLTLRKSLSELPHETRELLERHRFDPEWLLAQARLSRAGHRSNFVEGTISAPADDEVIAAPQAGDPDFERFRKLGEAALRAGKCALVVLAGGMATRMGGVVKALVPALEGKTFLDLRLAEQAALAKKYGKVPPLWLMTSHATHDAIEQALAGRLKAPDLQLFRQGLSVRLDPSFDVFKTDSGEPSLHAPGHGDLPDALRKSGLLSDFVKSGGQYVLVTNLDNLGGGLDEVLIGMHLDSASVVTCEVVDKVGSDRGGIPAKLDDRLVVLEEFRIPESFDPSTVPVFNVNSFAFDAHSLLELELDWTYFEVQKMADGRTTIQYERLINEVTFALPTQYVRVPRTGPCGRFLPVKDHDELARREDELRELALARGMVTQS